MDCSNGVFLRRTISKYVCWESVLSQTLEIANLSQTLEIANLVSQSSELYVEIANLSQPLEIANLVSQVRSFMLAGVVSCVECGASC